MILLSFILFHYGCGPASYKIELTPDSDQDTNSDSGQNDYETSGEVQAFPMECAAPASEPGFDELSSEWGMLDTDQFTLSRDEGNPAALADFDGDGDDDLAISSWNSGLHLLKNTGSAFFDTHVSAMSDPSTAVATFDLENDGDLDLVFGGVYGSLRLFENDGSGQFTDVTSQWGLDTVDYGNTIRHVVVGDYDLDGDLDLHLTGLTQGSNDGDRLFRHDGDHFTDMSFLLPEDAQLGFGWSSAWFDADLDGDLDLFTANSDQLGGKSTLIRNDGQADGNWIFTDVSQEWSAAAANTMGVTVGDFNRDGFPDLYLTSAGGPESLLIHDTYGGYFQSQNTMNAILSTEPRDMSFSALAFDYNNDGWEDLYITAGPHFGISTGDPDSVDHTQPDEQENGLLVGSESGFTDLASVAGVDDIGPGRSALNGFLNDDWAMDLVLTNYAAPSAVYINRCTENRGLAVELRGNNSNRFGVGARVILETDSGSQVRQLGFATGWGSSIHPRAWFGLGSEEIISLQVYWPSGKHQWVEAEADFAGRLLVFEPE